MMYMYTNLELIKDKIIWHENPHFNRIYKQGQKFNNAKFNKIIMDIDKAEHIFDDVVKTPFGYCDLTHLSTGCKVNLLACLYGTSRVVFTSCCGTNALNELIKLSKQQDIAVYVPFDFNALFGREDDEAFIDDVYYKGRELFNKVEQMGNDERCDF